MTIQDETNLPTANDTGERQAADVAKRAGGEVASTVADGALEMTSEAADQVKVVAGEAKAQLEDLFGRARDEACSRPMTAPSRRRDACAHSRRRSRRSPKAGRPRRDHS